MNGQHLKEFIGDKISYVLALLWSKILKKLFNKKCENME
jgi:hypothetical protein